MYEGNLAKFQQNPKLSAELISTQGSITFDNSTAFWCKWNGLIMELIREEIRPENIRNNDKIKNIWGQIESYEASQRK